MKISNIKKTTIYTAIILIIGCLCFVIYSQKTINPTGNDSGLSLNQNIIASQTLSPPPPEVLPITPAFELVEKIKTGWNLGNALDSCNFKKTGLDTKLTTTTPEIYYETLWKNPITTPAMIKAVADAGFGAVRVPVTYYDHMDGDFKISESWLKRVEEVVNYVLDNDMYCIINLHHDAGEGTWLKADPDNIEWSKEKLKVVWLQVAEYFKDYDHRLIFEGFNELLDKEKNWNGTTPAAYNVVNILNQVFVDTIRGADSYNKDRFLIVNTYAAGVLDEIVEAFILPTDKIDGRLIVGVHTYQPLEFTWYQEKIPWATPYSNWDEKKDGKEIETILKRLNTNFVKKGIPVIVGEFAAWNKANTQDRADYAAFFVSRAKQYNITAFWWDDGGSFEAAKDVTSAALLNRLTNEWFFPEIVKALIEQSK